MGNPQSRTHGSETKSLHANFSSTAEKFWGALAGHSLNHAPSSTSLCPDPTKTAETYLLLKGHWGAGLGKRVGTYLNVLLALNGRLHAPPESEPSWYKPHTLREGRITRAHSKTLRLFWKWSMRLGETQISRPILLPVLESYKPKAAESKNDISGTDQDNPFCFFFMKGA